MTERRERLIAACEEARVSLNQLVKDETERLFGMSAEEKKEAGRRQGSRFRRREMWHTNMTTETMVEKVGRALAKQEGYAYDPYPYDERAKAAIEAMREPTEAMIDAGEAAIYDLDRYIAEKAYVAMIDAALKE